jgi:Thermophilic metalloprotease (M29)
VTENRFAAAGWCRNLVEAGAVRAGERVLVVVDEPLAEEGSELAAAIRDAGAEPQLELWAGERPLAEPPRTVQAAAKKADLYIFLAQEPRADEAGARIALSEIARGRNGRALFLGFVDRELLTGELSEPAPKLGAAAQKLLNEVEGAEIVHITGRAGTDLTLKVTGRRWLTDALPMKPGDHGNYPGGEIYVAPLDDGADGVLVADLTVPYTVEGLVDEPVTVRFKGGSVTSIEGGRAAALLQEIIDEAGPSGRVIAELGIGLNPTVSPRGHVMLDEKAGGTAHVAIGSNIGSYGGTNESTIHVDCIFSEPQLEVDGRPVEIPTP